MKDEPGVYYEMGLIGNIWNFEVIDDFVWDKEGSIEDLRGTLVCKNCITVTFIGRAEVPLTAFEE